MRFNVDKCFTLVWDQETDERRAAKAMMDKDVLEMLQGLKIRNSRALQELTSLYEAWRGSAADWSPQFAEAISKPKVKGFSKGPKFTVPHPFQMMMREAEKAEKSKKMKAEPWADLHGEQEADDAECVKQFRAQPVPAHVFLPMYNEVMEQNEKRRITGIQERRENLLSMQKPFQLLAQDRKRPVSAPPEPVPHRKRPIPKSVLDLTVSNGLREAEILRKINSHLRAKDLLASSCAPVPLSRDIREPNSRTTLKTRQQHLGFLQQNLTFQPHVNQSVPDFHKLYRNFQKLSLKKQKTREPTETKPFNLRTSSLRSKIHSSTDVQEAVQETPPQRLLAHLSSLSPNTLPVYITDSTKRRDVAIRSSLQERNNQDKKNEKWLRERCQKSLTMQSSLSRRAIALDPHKPLAACNKEKLKELRQADRRRTQEYKEELEEMRRRVNAKEYLFEHVSKGCAIKDMERRFTQTLAQAGLKEDFVQQKGREHLEQSESHCSQHHDADSE
ncbi:protein FAM161B isoform X2 [Hyla sarda]|uniref:protein FAM161B isoform X2 n=1 Tax=Hyla sarda TaxID=327740 RepID=UPI0024C21C27|nr:protein FAM161B isoform X2 [Hyla sarda]